MGRPSSIISASITEYRLRYLRWPSILTSIKLARCSPNSTTLCSTIPPPGESWRSCTMLQADGVFRLVLLERLHGTLPAGASPGPQEVSRRPQQPPPREMAGEGCRQEAGQDGKGTVLFTVHPHP